MGIAGLDEHLLSAEELGKRAKRFDASALQKLLYDGRPVVRINTVNLAARVGPLSTLDLATLVTLLRDEDARVRIATARALGSLTQELAVCVPRLLAALEHADGDEAQAIIDAIMAYGDDAIPLLVRALDTSTAAARRIVQPVAERRKDRLREPMLAAMANTDSPTRIRENAAELLRTLLNNDKEVIAAIERYTESLKGPKPEPRDLPPLTLPPERTLASRELPSEAFETTVLDDDALGKLLGKDNKNLPDNVTLADVTYDGRAPVRANFARLAGLAGREPGEDLRARLLVLLRDSDARVRLAAARAIGDLTKHIDAVHAVPRLLEVIGRFDGPEHEAAVAAVLSYGETADAVLVRALDAATPWVMQTVGAIAARRDDLMRNALLEAMAPRDNPPRIRENAAELLKAHFKTDKKIADAIKDYNESLKGPQPEPRELPPLRVRADRALPERALPSPQFATQLLDDDAHAELLGKGKNKNLPDTELVATGLHDGRVFVRANFARLVGVAGTAPTSPAVADNLIVLLRDGDTRVRMAAAEAIGRLVEHLDPQVVVPRLLEVIVEQGQGRLAELARNAVLAASDRADAALVAALDDSTARVNRGVLGIVERRLQAVRPVLLEAMADKRQPPRIRENAAELLRALANDDTDVMAAVDAYEDSLRVERRKPELPPAVQRPSTAREAEPLPLDGFATEDIPASKLKKALQNLDVGYLERALNDGRAPMRINAARALGLLGDKATPAVPTLAVRLLDEDIRVTITIANTLAELKALPAYVMPMLGRALIEAPAVTRNAILDATDAYGKDGALALLDEFTKYPQRQHRAVTALARHKPEWYAAPLGDLLDNPRLQLRERAALILLELGPDAAPARKQLMAALGENKGGLRVTAINVLAGIGKKDKKLTEWLLEHHDDVRSAVAVASRQAMRAFGIEIPEDEDEDEDEDDDF